MIDLLMWLADNPRPLTATASAARLFPRKRGSAVPEAAQAERYDVEDIAFGHVRFESGFWITIEGAWTWDEPGWECRFDLVGDRAQASAEPLRFSAERSGEPTDITGGVEGDLDFPSSVDTELAADGPGGAGPEKALAMTTSKRSRSRPWSTRFTAPSRRGGRWRSPT